MIIVISTFAHGPVNFNLINPGWYLYSLNSTFGITQLISSPPPLNFVYINLCLSFFLSVTAIPRKIESNASGKFWVAIKVHKIWEIRKWHNTQWYGFGSVLVLNGYRFCPFFSGFIIQVYWGTMVVYKCIPCYNYK